VCIPFPGAIYMIVQVWGTELLYQQKEVTSSIRGARFELASSNSILISSFPFLVRIPYCVT